MLSVQTAREKLLAPLAVMPVETVHISRSAGRVLAETVHASFDLPAFSNSSMDGFALRAGDIQAAGADRGIVLKVVDDIPAGAAPGKAIKEGESARIMTGAQIPPGADTVVPVEYTNFEERGPGLPAPETVEIYRSQDAGDYVRQKGEDLAVGDWIYGPGVRLRPQDVGMLAMLGKKEVDVYQKPTVALLSTGDELLEPGDTWSPGKIFESNSLTLSSLISGMGAQVHSLGIAPDDAAAVQTRLDSAVAAGVDLIVSSAGVSVGAFDYVKDVVTANGSLDFWRVNMRPGKPLAFGEYRGIPYIGLPGNPVSSFVGFEVFVRFGLAKMLGLRGWRREHTFGVLGEEVLSDGRESYLRAVIQQRDNQPTAFLTGHQGSGNQHSLVRADALVIVPAGVRKMGIGDKIEIWPI